jgi:hypothetical protein
MSSWNVGAAEGRGAAIGSSWQSAYAGGKGAVFF